MRRFGWMGETLRAPGTRSFLWGVGATMAASLLWPAIREAVRPAAKGVVRGTMVAGDRFRYAVARAREGLEDVIAEAQFERMRDVAGTEGDASAELAPEPAAPATPAPRREH